MRFTLALLLLFVAAAASAQQCSDNIDNNADGRIDMADPYCKAPTDNDETSFRGGPTDDMNLPSSLDCWSDTNSGSGDDDCRIHACCLIDGPCPPALNPQTFNPANCAVSTMCRETCVPLTRPGCDCGGCCDIAIDGGPQRRLFLNPVVSPNCTLEQLGDPVACKPCRGDATCKVVLPQLFLDGFEG